MAYLNATQGAARENLSVSGGIGTAEIDNGAVTAAKLGAGAVETAKIAASAVTKAKIPIFISTEQTGTGSAQNIAHGLGVAPTNVVVIPTDTAPATAGEYTVTQGTHTTTNAVVTVTTGKKFVVIALV